MRHRTKRHILGVKSAHRSALLANLSVALITHGRIKTTLAKARALRPFIEKIVTLAKKADAANDPARKLHYRRLAIAKVRDKYAVAQLFDERVTEFANRTGGYTRILKLGARVSDAAETAIIEFLDADDEGYEKSKKSTARKAAPAKAEKAEVAVAEEVEEAPVAEEAAAEEAPVAEKAPATEEASAEEARAEQSSKATSEAPADAEPKAEADADSEEAEAKAPKKAAKKKAAAKKAAKPKAKDDKAG